MSIATTVKEKLEADTELTVLVTGGIYDWDETKRTGISYTNTPNAWDGPKIKPTILVKARQRVPTNDIVDEANQQLSYIQVIEIYFYEEVGYNIIETAMQRAYELLQHKKLADKYGPMQLLTTIEGIQAEDLGGANMGRMDFALFSELRPD